MVRTIKQTLDRIILFVSSVLTGILVVGAIWQVASRYLFNAPSTFTGELLRFLLVWTAILGASYAFGTNQHLALTFLKNKMKGKQRVVVRVINDLFIVGFAMLIMVRGGMEVVSITMSQRTPILDIPMGYVYSIVPICGVIIVIYKLLQIPDYKLELTGEEG
ncbi:C4-dicarboxylate ABC transporter permease [Pontibacillus halophilus JSM 076056 = DSM 19796]|uniref:C4-dicarboxylate ABC transporter permease n=1 Tax=Pontibacillus halophilus JSM 076056 = DSM 19796 TaxID=1385510 RepID=A0A0A5I2A0_9BACI|nr:TRAP transporter small permease [Pontibacillus halophilus]KGX89967.1 C4-dicarboxylate ABC transporter permease [Pontibacillus halophilus JSM 076056 = DSM 19796]